MPETAKQASNMNGLPNEQRPKHWLLSSNRKLRHLQGVAVRNLVISPPVTQKSIARGKATADDDNLPNALQTPAKRVAMLEAGGLHHSRSATDIKRAVSPASIKLTGSENENEQRTSDTNTRRRRRSTLPWAGANPRIRQNRLENMAGNRMADTWFSLHCSGLDQPIYVSDVVKRAMNPDFKYFDLNLCGPAVSRLDQVTLNLWAKSGNMRDYVLLLEMHVNLRSLQYIGKSLDSFYQPLPANSVIFYFVDGIYTVLTDAPATEESLQPQYHLSRSLAMAEGGAQPPTSSYDALMRLANLDDCIQDALATRAKLEAQINTLLEQNRDALSKLTGKDTAEEKLSSTKRALFLATKQLRQSIKRKDEISGSLKARTEAMIDGVRAQERTQAYLKAARSSKASSEAVLLQSSEESRGQIRRICEDLLCTYPIEPVPGKPLAFTIVGLPLPNSTFQDIDKDEVAAALGYTTHLVYLLSFYLSVPLPYPVQPYLSNSFIHDPISAAIPQRTFPLYPGNTQYRFEYGVFLLNKDIEYLMNRMGLRVLDIRHTLPNLKYLLYMLTAGSGDLPARKVGEIRGLFEGSGILPANVVPHQGKDRAKGNSNSYLVVGNEYEEGNRRHRNHKDSNSPKLLNGGGGKRGGQENAVLSKNASSAPPTIKLNGVIALRQDRAGVVGGTYPHNRGLATPI